MSRNKFIVILVFLGLVSEIFFMIGAVSNSKILIAFGLFVIMMLLLLLVYLMLVKKSINLLSGMTEEQAIEIKNMPDEFKKYEAKAKIAGYISLVVVVLLIYVIIKIIQ